MTSVGALLLVARRTRRTGTLATSTLAAALAVAGCGGTDSSAATSDNPGGVVISRVSQDTQYHGAEPATPYPMPDVTLTATNGQPFNLLHDAAYQVTLVFFGYTHCPDVCPLVMSDLTYVYLHLPAHVRAETQVLFITTDPARDSLATLRSYLGRYDRDFVGLTGSLDDIMSVADDMGVAVEGKRTLSGGGYEVGHGAQVIGFDGSSAPVIWTQGTSTGDIISDIEQIAAP